MRKNLISYRKKYKLTQKEIALKVGVSLRQYQNLEAGTSNGNLDTWYKLKGLFNATIDELLEQ